MKPLEGSSVNGSETPVFMNQKKSTIALCSLIAILIVGDIDYLTGYKVSLLVLYILPIGFATIYVGPAFASFLAVLSIAISICSDIWAGMPDSDGPALVWSAAIALTVFAIAIALLHALKLSLLRRQ
jgi:hypothetical protein